jgi:hypothetical protein
MSWRAGPSFTRTWQATTWNLIESGEVRCFSTESRSRDRGKDVAIVDGHKFVDRAKLNEISICRQGANPGATFHIVKPIATWMRSAVYEPGDVVGDFRGSHWLATIGSRGMNPESGSDVWRRWYPLDASLYQ